MLSTVVRAQTAPPPANPSPAAPVTTVQEVVVTGQRAALKSAVDLKKSADIIMDSINSDGAGKLPDASVTEVLERLPGISITRISTGAVGAEEYLAEGSGLQIRGLSSVTSLLNGRDTFSAVNGNVLSFEDVDPDLLQGVDVFKTLSPNLPEGGLGGTVNLRTRQPFDYKGLSVSGEVEANYADFAKETKPIGNLLVSDRWHTSIGEIGFMVNVAYSDLATRADGLQVQPYYAEVIDPSLPYSASQIPASGPGFNTLYDQYGGTELPSISNPANIPYAGAAAGSNGGGASGAKQAYIPSGIDFNERQDDRQRSGVYAALQWKPNSEFLFGLTVFDSAYRLTSFQHVLSADTSLVPVIPVGTAATLYPNGYLQSTSALEGYGFVQGSSATSTIGGGDGNQGNGSGYSYTNNPYDFETTLQDSFHYTRDISLTADWKPINAFDLKLAYQHVESGASETDKYAYDYSFVPAIGLNLSPYGSPILPNIAIPSSINLANPANYGYLSTMDHLSKNQGTEDAVYADGSYALSDAGLVRYIIFGVKLTTRYEQDEQTPYNYQGLSPFYDGGPYSLLSGTASGANYPQYSQLVNTGNWLGGGIGLPAQSYFPSLQELNTNFGTLHNQLGTGTNTTQQPVQFVNGDTSKITANEYSAYVMAAFRNDTNSIAPFRGNFGVRVVDANDSAGGNILYPAQNGEYVTPVSYVSAFNYSPNVFNFANPQGSYFSKGGHSEVDVLPSFNIQFLPNSQTHIRFAASEGVGRPSFAQISPGGTLGGTYAGTYVQNFITNLVGNPNLKPETALQLDGSFEYYFKDGGLIQAAIFYKKFDNYIGTHAFAIEFTLPTSVTGGGFLSGNSGANGPITGQPSGSLLTACATADPVVGTPCPQTVPATEQQYFNESVAASLYGLELGIQKYASFLKYPFNGLGIDANYTYVNSSQPGAEAYDTQGNSISGLPVTGISKDTINIQLLFDQGPISARLAYNWRDDFLVSTTAFQTSGVYTNLSYVPDTTNAGSVNQFAKPIYYALPVWQYPSGQLDANVSYRFSSHLLGVFEASNLTDTETRLYMGTGAEKANRSWYTGDRRFRLAIRFNY